MSGEVPSEGWAQPENATLFHYFVGTRSLCLRWSYDGRLELAGFDADGECQKCREKLAQRLGRKR